MKLKIYLLLQIVFMILTFLGGILLFIDKMDNAGMAICCMTISLAFGSLYNSSKNSR